MGSGNSNKSRIVLVAKSLVIALAAVVVLEVCTLLGSYTKSPLTLSDWSPLRMAILYLPCVACSYAALRLSPIKTLRAKLASVPWDEVAAALKQLIKPLLILALGSLAVALVAIPFAGSFDWRYALAFFGIGLAIYLLVRKQEYFTGKPERYFLVVALTFGLLSLAFMPAYADISWDGVTHFGRAQAVSFVVDPEYDGADALMSSLPSADWHKRIKDPDAYSQATSNAISSLDMSLLANTNEVIDDAARNGKVTQIQGARTYMDESLVNASMIGYLPNSFGLWLGRLLHLPALGRYTLARLLNLAAYCAIFFFAIRRIRYGKLIVAVVGLMPATLHMAVNFSYDPWCIAFISYAFARFFGVLQDDRAKLQPKDGAIILATFALGTMVKAVMFPLAFIFAFLPKDNFRTASSRRTWILCIGATSLLLMLSFALPFLSSGGNSANDYRGGLEVNSSEQVRYILQHPLSYARTLVMFTLNYLSLTSLSQEFGYLAPYLYPDSAIFRIVISGIQVLLIFVVAIFDHEASRANPTIAVVTIISDLMALTLVATALYVSFNAVASNLIRGVQLRYLYPFLVPTLVACLNVNVTDFLDERKRTSRLLGAQGVLLLSIMLFAFILRF